MNGLGNLEVREMAAWVGMVVDGLRPFNNVRAEDGEENAGDNDAMDED